MKKHLINKLLVAVIAASAPMLASAEAVVSTNGTSAGARLNFSVVIPGALWFGVGSGATNPAARGTDAAIDTVTFTVPSVAAIGNGTAVTGSTTYSHDGGATNVTGANVPVAVWSNVGALTISVTTGAANLVATSGATIPWASVTGSSGAAIPVPAFGSAANSTNVPLTAAASRTTIATDVWTFSYANSTAYGAGTYTGQATYTVSNP